MPEYKSKPGDGALFINDKREKEEQPNATGYVLAHRDIKAGEKLRMAAWTRVSEKGTRFQSLRMSDFTTGRSESTPVNVPPPVDDDDIPF